MDWIDWHSSLSHNPHAPAPLADLLSSWTCFLSITICNKLQCARPFATPSSWTWTGLVGLLLNVTVPHIGLTGLPCFTR